MSVTAIPATVFLVAMFRVPESPRWLATKKKPGEALRILARVGGSSYGDRVLQEIDQTLLGEFLVPWIFKPTLLGIATRNGHVTACGGGHRCVRDDIGSDNLGAAF
jgi:Sugar (and other) transporter